MNLPQAQAQAEAEAEALLRVLVVGSDPADDDYLRVVMGEDGMAVRVCADAAAALAQAHDWRPDVVVAVLAAGNDGATFAGAIRAHDELDAVPLIFLSNRDDDRLRFGAIAAGADDYLVKPVAAEVLLLALRSRVARARMHLPRARPAGPSTLRSGQMRRGEFLAQLGMAMHDTDAPWRVLIAVRLDQGQDLGDSLGQTGAFALEGALAARFAPALSSEDSYTLWMEFGFGILLERDNRADVEAVASDICRRIAAEPFHVGDKEFALTVSVGVALPPGGTDAGDPDRWFASAYAAQAIAHRLGGNRFDGVLSRDHGEMPAERVLIIREWVKEAVAGDNVLIEFQPVLPLNNELAGLYYLQAKLRDYRAPLAGVQRKEYLTLAREAGALPMIDRMSLFSAFAAIEEERAHGRATRVLVPIDLAAVNQAQLRWLDAELRRRKAHADGLIIEFDAASALDRPELGRIVQILEEQGVLIAISDDSGNLQRILAIGMSGRFLKPGQTSAARQGFQRGVCVPSHRAIRRCQPCLEHRHPPTPPPPGRPSMTVQTVMTANPACCTPSSSVTEVARLMVENDCGEIPVVEDMSTRKLAGVITDRDIATRIVATGRNSAEAKASDCMTTPAVSVKVDTSLDACCEVMEGNKIRRVPVVDDRGGVVGIVALADVVRSARPNETASVVKGVSTDS